MAEQGPYKLQAVQVAFHRANLFAFDVKLTCGMKGAMNLFFGLTAESTLSDEPLLALLRKAMMHTSKCIQLAHVQNNCCYQYRDQELQDIMSVAQNKVADEDGDFHTLLTAAQMYSCILPLLRSLRGSLSQELGD